MASTVDPIFLFSLPRSGSTLLQRIIAKHPAIETAAEPWILLPLLSTLRSEGIYTNYDQNAVVEAVKDFYAGMDGGRETFTGELRELTMRFYAQRSSPQAKYFLDKTPRYHLIVKEILEVFPNGKFIFLWRNPLSIIASMLDTWHRGHWYLYFFKVDLYDGFERLVEAYTGEKDRVLGVNYEDILLEPEKTCRRICDYLDLSYLQDMIEDFQSVDLAGDMGDPTGVKAYQNLSAKPLEKWKNSLRNPLRKRWCRSYLNWAGEERLNRIGYDLNHLLSELDDTSFSLNRLGGDLARLSYGAVYQLFELRLLQDKLKTLPEWKRIHPHL